MNNLDHIRLLLREPDAPLTAELADMIDDVVTEAGIVDRDDFGDPLLVGWNQSLSRRHWQRREDTMLANAVHAAANTLGQGDVRLTTDELSRLNDLLREFVRNHEKDDL
jgi:hypothetical protein